MDRKSKLNICLGVATVIFAGWTAFEANRANRLADRVAEFESARFHYVAEIKNGDLILRNLGDEGIEPQTVDAIAVFPGDRVPNQAGIPVPFDEVAPTADGVRVFENIKDIVCKHPLYFERCVAEDPTQLVLVFKRLENSTRDAVAF